ncbi:MAG TPA: methyltransferase [Aquaticitalea sp.]|nr:methyltransferase [Aquaticitalea sp.]HNU58315.1 methyltransferase [Aquaticitalea sp.]
MNPFKFKQFTIHQDRCAMKIGTDSVLLGAWALLDKNPNTILDIGAGTGVLALMMAQRSRAELIDAIEIDDNAYEQCVENFEESPWSDRLFCYHADLEAFTHEIDDRYDLIISNPPFYSDTFKSADSKRDLARHVDAMPFDQLAGCVSKLLSEDGTFNVILPYSEEKKFVALATRQRLFPNRLTRVKGSPNSETKRSLIAFSFQEKNMVPEELIIETERHRYSEAYIDLTKDFYIKM